MKSTYTLAVQLPTVAEVTARYRHYGPALLGDEEALYDIVVTPANFVRAKIATDDLELPAVAGVARSCADELHERGIEITPYRKQIIGALVCVLMEANGYEKTALKRAVPHPAFTRGEVYRART